LSYKLSTIYGLIIFCLNYSHFKGLNRLAAVALLFMPEEDAFWCLVAIVETIMPNDYFGRNLLGI
jgi:hypothetical protein